MILFGRARALGAAALFVSMAMAGAASAGGPSVSMFSNINPSNTGQAVNLTATISSGNGVNTCPGSIVFNRQSGTSSDTLTCSGGNTQTLTPSGGLNLSAVCTATFNTVGTNLIRGTFATSNGGANGCGTGSSASITQTVNAAPVPTIADWGKFILVIGMMGSGLVFMARRNRQRLGL